jgi:RNA:NAD 2'-phosphotransferase (TPT1/KptA family)
VLQRRSPADTRPFGDAARYPVQGGFRRLRNRTGHSVPVRVRARALRFGALLVQTASVATTWAEGLIRDRKSDADITDDT